MRNLTPFFGEAKKRSPGWDGQTLTAVLQSISEALPGSHVTTDLDAGMHWVRVERRDTGPDYDSVYALVWQEGPLVLLWDKAPSGIRGSLESRGVVVVEWHDYDEPEYCIDRSALQELFPYRQWDYDADDPDKMSIYSLVDATL